ncbi:MAG: hypothetical protein DVS81_05120 [Candidatus Accumulibacter meliphilus]|jgi:hypothetical protein|uniref:Uncharacterized protein n=1 Tax=Candidatus Accumulibacter meliphilus TaxID=2211374 RepID=A0A369XNK0_9PROT|nr:MAG: hypothetical protein DVS81_05120 [Candidatus Accumulibacter meliphilus]
MSKLEQPLDADDLMILAERIEQLSADDAEWVNRLLQELLRARAHEGELLAGQASSGEQGPDEREFDEQMAQVALDTAEWLKTLWEVGYMGAGNFRAQPRAAFPAIDLEDVRKSSLFARIRQGRHALPFPPPTRQGLPWHELVEGGAQTQIVSAEIVREEDGLPMGAIIEGCSDWMVLEEDAAKQECIVQHQGKGPRFRLRQVDAGSAQLRRELPSLTRQIHLQGRGGFHSYGLEWPRDDGTTQFVALRAATWERAQSEAEHWLAITHPELYGQVRFVGSEK